MKAHTTNYKNTFIEIAEDCPAKKGEMPPIKGDKKTVANLQFDMLYDNPYTYTSDEVLFRVHAIRKEVSKSREQDAWDEFFSKGQACFRASPLTKRYGWGVHSDESGKIALYCSSSESYKKLQDDEKTPSVMAMRSKRAT